jgi:hypothetical protein
MTWGNRTRVTAAATAISGTAVAGWATVLVLGGGTAAPATHSAVWRQDNGIVGIDNRQLRPQYYGRTVSLAEIERLNAVGKAMASVSNMELACHGITLVFDTTAEADAYGRGYLQRAKAVSAQRRASDANNSEPCAFWRGPIPGV